MVLQCSIKGLHCAVEQTSTVPFGDNLISLSREAAFLSFFLVSSIVMRYYFMYGSLAFPDHLQHATNESLECGLALMNAPFPESAGHSPVGAPLFAGCLLCAHSLYCGLTPVLPHTAGHMQLVSNSCLRQE